ncbi:MAG: AAA family ATPase [Rheinheimera sp.]|nr:AAA family ATPase [Rheinheimera sp.]
MSILQKNVFITGNAGVGKSKVTQVIVQNFLFKNKKIGVTSSTTISAININGTTLHSFLGIGISIMPASVLYKDLIDKRYKSPIHTKLKKLEILIIDEISMINGDLFELIDEYLQLIKKNDLPFGGVQLILIGDFYQLLPVKIINYVLIPNHGQKQILNVLI